jgi:DMSO/TMAO reductase YedYZ molybdopterin-dependent catalytic subunit
MSEPRLSNPDRRKLSFLAGALIGVLALAAALAAGHLVAAFVGINASPYLAVGNSAIDLSPGWLKDFAIRTFGDRDKVMLLRGMVLVMGLLAVLAGVLSRRFPAVGAVIITAFGVVGFLAVITRPDLGQLAVLAPIVSIVAGVATFFGLHSLARTQAAAENAPRSPAEAEFRAPRTEARNEPRERAAHELAPGRRRFLAGAGGVAVGAGVAGLGGVAIANSRDASRSRAAVGPLLAARPAPPIPPGAAFPELGTPAFITPDPEFYRVDTALVVPQVRTDEWSLRIHGMVDNAITLGYADITSRPLVERTITMTCVSNPLGGPYISTAKFIGVDLRDLLDQAGVRPDAEQLYSTSVDGYTAGTPVRDALDPERGAMLAIGMNGRPLPIEHGFPARMVIPGLYGYVSATKWVTDLEVTTWEARQAYWLRRGWAQKAPVKTQSRIDSPKSFETVSAGRVPVAGIAWAQPIGIRKVEIQVDDGRWREADLSTEVNEDTWRMWRIDLDLAPGPHKVVCRATDKSGYTQTPERVDTLPDGATGRHSITFTAR